MRVWSGTQFSFKLVSGLYLNLPDSKAFVGIFIHLHFSFLLAGYCLDKGCFRMVGNI